MKESILITGASGFIGSFLVEEALKRGMQVWAGVRNTSSRRYLQHRKLHLLELDMAHPEQLKSQLSGHKGTYNRWDYVIHCAGATKCVDKAEFDQANYLQTRHLVEALSDLQMIPRQLIYLSSLSVYGPIHEQDGEPIRETDTPCPNTAYGESKLKAERYLQSLEGLPYVIFRPTGVYGPRERDYFLMVKSISRHIDTAAGLKPQQLTFVYVRDVVQAVFGSIDARVTRRAYLLSDGQVYSSRTFSDLIRRELGNPWVVRLTFPLWTLRLVSRLAEWWAGRHGKSSTLNSDKYRIMKQRNWQCDITPAVTELGYRPQYDLQRGVAECMAWYKQEGWI